MLHLLLVCLRLALWFVYLCLRVLSVLPMYVAVCFMFFVRSVAVSVALYNTAEVRHFCPTGRSFGIRQLHSFIICSSWAFISSLYICRILVLRELIIDLMFGVQLYPILTVCLLIILCRFSRLGCPKCISIRRRNLLPKLVVTELL